MKILFSCMIVFLMVNIDPSERFTYEEHSQLSWKDFKGVPPRGATHFASVNSGMGYSFLSESTGGKLTVNVEVKSYFYPQLSWKKNINESNQGLLKHEQLHWDISELHARKLRAAYKRYVPQNNPKKEVDFIFRKFEKDRQNMQNAYDKQTNHGLIKEVQARWVVKINEELFKTSAEAK